MSSDRWTLSVPRVFALLVVGSLCVPPVALAAPPEDEAAPAGDEAGDEAAAEDEASAEDAPADSASEEAPSEEAPPEEVTEGEPAEEAPAEEEPASEAPADAGAVPDAELKTAKEKYYRAVEHFQLGKYDLAIPLFEAVYRELGSEGTDLLYNLGQCYWKRFNTDPKIEHLKTARTMFENYDKAMRAVEGYNYREVEAYIAAIDAQIAGIEAAEKPVELREFAAPPPGPDPELLEFERQRRVNTGMTATGITLSVLGGAALIAGGVSLAVRGGNKFALDQAGEGEAGVPNPLSAEEDAQLRKNYLRSGQVAFGTLIGGAALFPVGLSLAIVGSVRNKRLVAEQKAKYAVTPTATGVRVKF